jgi:predicted esterase
MQVPHTPDHRPRLLCLHGGGTTGAVFRAQLRAFAAPLSASFRLVFADAPFLCDAGPGVLPVFADAAPFRRWLRWIPGAHAELDDDAARDEIWWQLREAMDGDDAAGGAGPWAALVGFSQGAKMAASLLYEAQWREQNGVRDARRPDWKFAVLMAGRAPLVSLRPETDGTGLQRAGEIYEAPRNLGANNNIITRPTVHVHGLQDPGLPLHRRLLDDYCAKGTTSLVEWDGGHRLPIKAADVKKVTEAIFSVAKRTGVLDNV